MRFSDAVARLAFGLRQTLPGAEAQARLAPVPRREWPAGFNAARIRDAAGLLLVFPKDEEEKTGENFPDRERFRPDRDQAYIVLTVRAGTLGRHGGQVSLPGGVVEAGESFEQAALREAHEEIGLSLETVRVLGALTPLDIPVSGFRLHPIVAVSDAQPALSPADGEVARILEVAVEDLLDPAHFRRTCGTPFASATASR